MHPLAQAIKDLPQYQLGARIEMDQALRHADPFRKQPAQGPGIRLGIEVAAGQFRLSGTLRFFEGRQRIFTKQQLDPLEPAAILL
jgi:hypothetical protein